MAIAQTPGTIARTTWAIDPTHTLVEFSVKHMMVTNVKGRFPEVEGTIVTDESNPVNSQIDVTINAASIDTRNEQRDAHLRSADFFDVENFPTITFKSTKIVQKSEDELTVVGDLSIHGVTREVELDATVNGRGKNPYGFEVAGITAETKLNRKDFGLVYNMALESGGLLVSDTVKVLIEVQAVKQ